MVEGDRTAGYRPPSGTPAARSKSPIGLPLTVHFATTRSHDREPATQRMGRPRAIRESTSRACRPPGSPNSGASKSTRRTSTQVEVSAEDPTHRLSPSPMWRTVPLKTLPGLSQAGRGPLSGIALQGSARAGAAKARSDKAIAADESRRRLREDRGISQNDPAHGLRLRPCRPVAETQPEGWGGWAGGAPPVQIARGISRTSNAHRQARARRPAPVSWTP